MLQHALPKQIKLRTAIGHALNKLEAIDFDLPGIPVYLMSFQRAQPQHPEATFVQNAESSLFRSLLQWRTTVPIHSPPFTKKAGKGLREPIACGDVRVCCKELVYQHVLINRQFLDVRATATTRLSVPIPAVAAVAAVCALLFSRRVQNAVYYGVRRFFAGEAALISM